MKTEKKTHWHLWYFLAAFWVIILIQQFWMQAQQTESIPYSQFERELSEGKIRRVYIHDQVITGDYTQPQKGKAQFVTTRVDPQLATALSKYGVEFSGIVHSEFLADLVSWVAPALIFFLIWYYGFRKLASGGLGGGLMTVGQSKAKIYVDKDTGITFDDVAGMEEAKAELHEIVEFLKNPKEYGRLGAHIPKGVLLVGPPGTGKTLLAKAIAGEAKVPFFSIGGSEFVEMFVGVGAARVRDLFDQAKKQAPAIIFIDELDALGRARGSYIAGHSESEQTLNQLLSEMDGFDSREGVVIIAATNRPEVLDAALLRAGRFDRQVLVDKPDKNARKQILDVHARKIRLAPDADLEKVAAMTTGFSGADLANLVNEAAIQATRRNADAVSMEDFTHAVERIVAGLERKSRILTPFERKVTAYHELGHALVSLALPGVETVHKVSIVQRGIGALGYTIQRPTEDRYLMTRKELENKIAVLLGGRAAEKLVFHHSSTGAADDLAKATDIARSMAAKYGMDEDLGYVSYEEPRNRMLDNQESMFEQRKYSEATAARIDATVRSIIAQEFQRATEILEHNRPLLERCAAELLKNETLEEDRLRKLTASLWRPVIVKNNVLDVPREKRA